MKFIHIADVHASRERYECIKEAFNQLTVRVQEGDIDAVLVAGDFWNSTITNTDASHFPDFMHIIKELAEYTSVFFIYGTPEHEPAGSLECLDFIENVHVVHGYTPSVWTKTTKSLKEFNLIALPEPRLSMYKGNSIEDKYNTIQKELRDFVKKLSVDRSIPTLCMIHNEISGCKFKNGLQIGRGKTTVDINILKEIKADYYACGHIHQPQDLGNGLNGGYCGSLVPLNFGETHRAQYIIFEVSDEE